MSSVDGTSTYSYDDMDQLTGVTQSFQSNEAYSFDLNGNRTNAGYQTGQNNRLSTDGTYNYLYDDEGNLTRRTTISTNETAEYTWDYRNRLTQVTVKNASNVITRQVNFVYDALNRRIEKRVDPDGSGPTPATIERFIYDRDHIKLVFNGSNTLIRRYLHGPTIDQILADEDVVAKQISWPLSDHQGSVRDWVNNSGVIQNHLRYDSFGKVVSQTTPALKPRFAYTGREWDSEIDLYFYRARYYDPMVGRFIGEDAIGFGAGDGNLYRYVYNSTINRTDPMGMQVVAPPPPVAPLITPIATPWYTPILRIAPLITIPLSIPGGLLNPTTTNPYEFPDEIPNPNACPIPKMQRKKRCELKYEIPGRPDYAFKVCAYDCKGYGALATFPWPNDLPCPESFDGLFPRIPPGYPDPNMPRM